ncbi:MAG: molybdopterin biosynthesis protein, partial [Chloroflexota bacterium]
MPHNPFLEDIPLDEARRRLEAALERHGSPLMGSETVSLDEALGRITAAPVWAAISAPHYHGAAMDGIAVQAIDTLGASESNPVRLSLGTQAHWVDTGDPLPEGTNAVIMLEHLQRLDDETVEIMAGAPPWQHVRQMGEDIVATELVLPEGHRLRPADLGAIAACGNASVIVRRKPRVAIMPTGTELVPPSPHVKPGQIIEFNSLILAGQVAEWGGAPTRLPVTSDNRSALRARLLEAVEQHDVVLINAGSSAGSEDFTADLVTELGELLVHGVAIRPGHPVILGMIQSKPVIGVPGYPVSAALTSELFVRPLLAHLLGIQPEDRPRRQATLTRKVLSPMGDDEFLRVKLGVVGGKTMATPLQRGAGVIMSLVRADGIVTLPRFSEGAHAGQDVEVELLRTPNEIERTIVAIGSHDLTLDLISSELVKRAGGLTISSSNVGSLGGLIALERGEAHLAGSHLLDEESGEYNVAFVRQYVPNQPVTIVNLVFREQGLIVPPGNPMGFAQIPDLARAGVRFVNRQRGSGTRVLLDYRLKLLGIDPTTIDGYEREEYTHLMVAASIAGGTADVGMGILAAARALHLDFVPLLKERYDLIIPTEHYESALLQPLIALIR